jgi:WD40 repeat protein
VAVERSDVFVSYSREDGALVHRIVAALEARDKIVWVDFDDIPPSVDWFEQIATGIDGADNFVCVITPDWVGSEVSGRELAHAESRNKRVLPVLGSEVDAALVPPAAAKVNWIRFDRPETFDDAIATLVEQLETDLPHVQGHTRWGQEAQDWERHDRDPAYLLRGAELTSAEQWLTAAAGRDPPPTPLHNEFLVASRHAATRRQRQLFIGVAAALAVSVLLTIFALIQRSAAIDQRNTALSRELGAQAERSYARDPELAVLLAAEGVKAQQSAESEETLRTALVRSRVRARDDLGAEALSVDVSPDSKLYVVSTRAARAFVYDLATNRRLGAFHTHTAGADVVWDGASERLAVGGADGVARIFAARSGRVLAELGSGHDVVGAVAWSPDGRELAVAAQDTQGSGIETRVTGGAAQVWDATAKRRVATLAGHERGASALAWTGDGKTLLTGGPDPGVRVWRARDWTLRRTLRHAGDDEIAEIATPAVGSDVAVTSALPRGPLTLEGVAGPEADRVGTRVWDLRTGELIRAFPRSIGPAAINPDGSTLAFGPPGNVIQVFDIAKSESRPALSGHDGPIRALRYSRSGVYLVSSSADGTVRVWNPSQSELVATFAGHQGEVVAADADIGVERVVSGGQDGTARVWSVAPQSGAVSHTGGGAIDVFSRAFVPAISPDGRLAVSSYDADAIDVWDAKTGKTLRTLAPAVGRAAGALFTRDGHRLLTVHAGPDANGEVVIWDPSSWKEVARVRPADCVATLMLSPSGLLASTGGDGTATVWTLRGERVAQVRPGRGPLNDAALSDDGALLVTAAADRTATLWSVPEGRRLHELRGHGGLIDPFERDAERLGQRTVSPGVVTADFDAGAKRVATAGADGTARIWDVASGKLEHVLRGHTESVVSVEFSPDGARLLTGSADGTARVWRADTGAQILSVDHLPAANRVLGETRARWTSDGEYFVTDGVGSPTVSLWRADSGLRVVKATGQRAVVRAGGHDLVTSLSTFSSVYRCEACVGTAGLERLVPARTTRALTKEERVRYLHEAP